MQLEYRTLLKIQLQHGYFADGNCPSVEMAPSPVTQQLLRALDIRMVERDYGVELFYGIRDGQDNRLAELSETLRLSFWLRPTDNLFYNYTEHLPAPGSSALFYATNYGMGNVATAEFILSEKALCPIKGNPFEQVINGSTGEVSVAEENGYPVAEENVTISPSANSPTQVIVSTQDLQAARYFWVDGDDATPFVSAADGYRPGDIGLFTLYLGENGNGQHSVILADGTIEPATFTLSFSTRATIWRYNLIDPTGKIQNLRAGSGGDGPELKLADPPKRLLPDGTEATVLVSTSPIELRERPPQRFALSYTDESGRAHDNAIPLPNANSNTLSQGDPNSTTLYSDVYVYL